MRTSSQITRLAPVSLLMLAASVLITLVYFYYDSTKPLLFLYISQEYGRGLREVRAGEWWRLVTPSFVHIDLFHLLFNGILLWELGRLLEPWVGRVRYSLMVLVLAVGSNLAEYWVSGPNFGGLSGILFGLLGFIAVYGYLDRRAPVYLPPYLLLFVLAFFTLAWLGVFGRIANVAHTAGLLGGILIGAVAAWSTRRGAQT